MVCQRLGSSVPRVFPQTWCIYTQTLGSHHTVSGLVGAGWGPGIWSFSSSTPRWLWFGNAILRAKNFLRFNWKKLKIAEVDVTGPSPEQVLDVMRASLKHSGSFSTTQDWRKPWRLLFTFGWKSCALLVLLPSFGILNVFLLKCSR